MGAETGGRTGEGGIKAPVVPGAVLLLLLLLLLLLRLWLRAAFGRRDNIPCNRGPGSGCRGGCRREGRRMTANGVW